MSLITTLYDFFIPGGLIFEKCPQAEKSDLRICDHDVKAEGGNSTVHIQQRAEAPPLPVSLI